MGQLAFDTVSIFGGIASIIGLIITIMVFRRIRRIEASFSTQALLPVYHRKLGGSIKNLEQHQKDKDPPQTRTELAICRSRLVDLNTHLKDDRAEQVTQAIEAIDRLLELPSDVTVWEQTGSVIGELEGVRERVGNLMEEMQWRGRDA